MKIIFDIQIFLNDFIWNMLSHTPDSKIFKVEIYVKHEQAAYIYIRSLWFLLAHLER